MNPILKPKSEPPQRFWRKQDAVLVVKILLVGLAVGMTVRYLNSSAPIPVMAAELHAANTNAPTEIKIEGASPSARD